MSSTLEFVLEQIASGQIDKQIGIQLVKRLRAEQPKPSAAAAEEIAVIGMAVRLPMADHYETFWANLAAGVSCTREVPAQRKVQADRLTGGKMRYARAGYLSTIDEFDYPFFQMSPAEANLLDPNQRIFLQTAWAALEDAGYGGRSLSGTRTGVFLGYNAWPTYGTILSQLYPERMSVALPGNIAPIIASRLSHLLDLQGPSLSIDTTCSSSLVAVHTACQSLIQGECDTAVAGGIKLNIMPVDQNFKLGIETAGEQTRTFDDQADGTLWGEGAAAVLLKPLSQAKRDGDQIYAVIKGSAINHDGTSIGLTAPNALAQEKVLTDAWKRAGVNPETLSYMEAHGTGTKLGDPIEIDGIIRAFRRHTSRRGFCGIGSVKSNIGHLDGASGIVSLVKAILCLKKKQLPPSLGFTRPNRSIRFEDSPLYVNDTLRDWISESAPRRCGVSSFGFSGTNCHVVLEEAPAPAAAVDDAGGRPELLVLSAKEGAALTDYIRQVRDWVEAHPEQSLAELCYTANTGRSSFAHRAAFAASSREEMLQALSGFLQADTAGAEAAAAAAVSSASGSTSAAAAQMRVDSMFTQRQGADLRDTERLQELASAFIQGASIPWKSFYAGEHRCRTSLPTYPFRRYSCWMELPDELPLQGDYPAVSDRPGDSGALAEAAEAAAGPGGLQVTRETMEAELLAIWREVLGVEEISLSDDFAELGGHSILAVRVEAMLNDRGYEFEHIDYRQFTTIENLAAHLVNPASEE